MKIGIAEAFRKYGASLNNVNSSVSSWVDEDTLVLSLWAHHHLRGQPLGVMAFGDRFDRWSGPGNSELRRNLALALKRGAAVKLVLARAIDIDRVQRGEDGSKIPKTYAVREDLIGRVREIDGEHYVVEFRTAAA